MLQLFYRTRCPRTAQTVGGVSNQERLATVSKHTPVSGIYLILNTKSGKGYIGQAQDIQKRCLQHRRALRNGYHYNPHLQAAWNKDGEGVFEFRRMEHCRIENLNEREQFYIDLYMPKGLLYNIAFFVDAPTRGRMRRASSEARERMSKSAKERFQKLSGYEQSQIRWILRCRKRNAERFFQRLRES